jgi:hypothetical protein
MPSILLVVKHAELDRHNAELLRQMADESEGEVAANATAGGDRRRLRGVPAIARGVSGGMRGTLPHVEIEKLELRQ